MKKIFFLVLVGSFFSLGNASVFGLKLKEAEERVLGYSNDLKSSKAAEDSALEKANANYTSLFPKLSLEGMYQYNFTLPKFDVTLMNPNAPPGEPVTFGYPTIYNIGPYISYDLWDTGYKRKTYEASNYNASSKGEERKSTELAILRQVRQAYIEVQRGNEELRLTFETLELSRAQHQDILLRFKQGASSKLDVATSERSVLSYEIQFQKRQAELAQKFQELVSLIGQNDMQRITKPGPPSIKGVSLVLKLDPIKNSLDEELKRSISPPDENHPQLRSLQDQAKSADLMAATYRAKQYPFFRIYGAIYYTQPNLPNPIQYWQEYAGVTLTFPLWLGDPAPKQAAEQVNLSMQAQFKREQLNEDIKRDFSKAKINLESLTEQKMLAEKDVLQSEKVAKLYYNAYKAGKVDILEVQNSNVAALESKVSLTRIISQMLHEITTLKSLSGQEYLHE